MLLYPEWTANWSDEGIYEVEVKVIVYSCYYNGDGVVIVDAGGGTIDISSYSRNQKGNFEEIAAPQCSFVIITLKIANLRSL